ncbi:protein PHLOEM PROTEIN 2-LIKE A10-like [Wolffia australiana]
MELLRSSRRWRFLLFAVAGSAAGVFVYRRSIGKLLRAFNSMAETANIVSDDLSSFLRGDSDEIPPSLKQILKMISSVEISEDLTAGIVRGLVRSEENGSSIEREEFRRNFSRLIEIFAGAAVSVYLEKTAHLNPFDQIFSAVAMNDCENKIRDFLIEICSEAVATLVRTSQLVGSDRHGWAEKLSSAMDVPRNKRLVLDLTGRVASETVRSSLDFFLGKLMQAADHGVKIVREEIVDKGILALRVRRS